MKLPRAYEAVFRNSFGVAAGRAMMTAMQSLFDPIDAVSTIYPRREIHVQDVEDNIERLKSRKDSCA